MAITFPSSPTDGQVYSPGAPAPNYVWRAAIGAWQVVAAIFEPRKVAKLQLAWETGAVVTNDTLYFLYETPYAGTIDTMKYFTGIGSFIATVRINGVNVTGLTNINVNNTVVSTATATALRSFTAGQRLELVITSATSNPTDALLILSVTWS